MILIVDNFDSFTYNLVQRLGEIDDSLDIRVFRNDAITTAEIESLSPDHIIISPGPCTPNEAGISVDCVKHFHGRLPMLGVCLGHQPMTATRYHSLVIKDDTLSDEFDVTAWADGPNGVREIMGVQHKQHPTFGVQFHPESFLTENGIDMLNNFIKL